jgi:hypothetical protein
LLQQNRQPVRIDGNCIGEANKTTPRAVHGIEHNDDAAAGRKRRGNNRRHSISFTFRQGEHASRVNNVTLHLVLITDFEHDADLVDIHIGIAGSEPIICAPIVRGIGKCSPSGVDGSQKAAVRCAGDP